MSPTTRIEAKNSTVKNVRNSGDVDVVATAGSVVKDVSVGESKWYYNPLGLVIIACVIVSIIIASL